VNALVMVLVLGASDVSLRVEAGTPCLEQRRLASLLVAQGLVVRAGAPLEVLARGTGASLSLVGTRGAEHFSRTVPAGVGECAAVERIVVSLINSWAQPLSLALRSEPKVDAGVVVRAGVDPALVVDAGRLAARVVDARVLVPDAGVEITTIDAGEFAVTSPETVPPPVVVEPEIVVVEVVDAGVPLEPDGGIASASPLTLTLSPAGGRGEAVVDVSVLGGGAIGPTETVAGTGSVRVGFSVGRFGAVLDANLETERTKAIAEGTAFATRQWLGLSARTEFRPLETLLLDVTLGVRGTRVIVGGRDFPDAQTAPDLFDFGGTFTGGARVLLFGPVWLEGRAMAGLRTRVTALVLKDPATNASTPLLTVQPWDIGLSLGLCARF
jgi:hypothetical protein